MVYGHKVFHRPGLLLVALCGLGLGCSGVYDKQPGSGLGMGSFHPGLRAIDRRLAAIARELATCPYPSLGPTTDEVGYHSEIQREPAATAWVQLDLGHVWPVDKVALVPAQASPGEGQSAGYGFPVRFRIDLAERADFAAFATLADQTGADLPNPGVYPFIVAATGRRGRYLRVTATQLYRRQHNPDRWAFALGEIMVLSGNRDVALGAAVTPPSGLEVPPTWTTMNLVDGRSGLGMPQGSGASRSNGYHGYPSTDRDGEHWVEIDLGRVVPLDEIRLIPARPTDWPDQAGFGFPVRFRITVAGTDRLGSVRVVSDHTAADFTNPRDNPVVVLADGRPTRYIRVTATRLVQRLESDHVPLYVFALAELQAYAGDENVARGAAVTTSDSVEDARYARWSANFLVDGMSSTHPLLETSVWLDGLVRRQRLEREMAEQKVARSTMAERAAMRIFITGVAALLLLTATAVTALVLQGRARQRHVERMRRQIASDLHDEVGSGLGTIALISQLAAHGTDLTGDLGTIHQIARDTAESLRDIVFLGNAAPVTVADLFIRMRDATRRLPPALQVVFQGPEGPGGNRPLPITLWRHLLLAYREIVHNVAKHARASRIATSLLVQRTDLVLTVSDDGVGFDPAAAYAGQGLPGLQERAQTLGGNLTIDSGAGRGTQMVLRVPLGPPP